MTTPLAIHATTTINEIDFSEEWYTESMYLLT